MSVCFVALFVQLNNIQVFKSNSLARLVDRNRHKVDVTTMRFSMTDRLELVAFAEASEDKLGTSRITDWLSPAFFENNFTRERLE